MLLISVPWKKKGFQPIRNVSFLQLCFSRKCTRSGNANMTSRDVARADRGCFPKDVMWCHTGREGVKDLSLFNAPVYFISNLEGKFREWRSAGSDVCIHGQGTRVSHTAAFLVFELHRCEDALRVSGHSVHWEKELAFCLSDIKSAEHSKAEFLIFVICVNL